MAKTQKCFRLSKITKAHRARGGDGGHGTSGCSELVGTAARGVDTAFQPTFLSALSANSGSPGVPSSTCPWEGGCTGNAQAGIQIVVLRFQLARRFFRYVGETVSRPLSIQA